MLPEAGTTATGLLVAAGVWALGGAAVGLATALLVAPFAARWTRGGRAAGCLWATLLALGLGVAGLYGGAAYGVARECVRLIEEEWLLERVAVTTLLEVAEERERRGDAGTSLQTVISEARDGLEARMAGLAVPGSATLGLRLPQLVRPVFDAFEAIEHVSPDDLRGLRLGAADAGIPMERSARLSGPARTLITSTAPIRRRAVEAIWGATLPHLLAAAVIAAVSPALILLAGTVSRVIGRQKRLA